MSLPPTDPSSSSRRDRLAHIFRYSLIGLPYLSYLTFPGFLYVIVGLYRRYPATVLDRGTRFGLLAIALLMGLSTVFAYDRGQALLQLFNFLPFFVFFGVVPVVLQTLVQLEQLALGLVVASLPLNLLALIQFLLKLGLRKRWVPREFRQSVLGEWARSLPHQNRASSIFDHPNVFASYLVIILGLGLGIWLHRRLSAPTKLPLASMPGEGLSPMHPGHRIQHWLYRLFPIALLFTLLGLYTTGSRNGMGVALLQFLVFIAVWSRQRGDRRVVYISLAGLGILLAGIASVGLAGRIITVESVTTDPRLEVWRIAFSLFQQRPWLGWGLGSYPELYPTLTTNTEYDYISHTHNLWLLLTTEAGILVSVGLTIIIGRLYAHSILTLIRAAFTPKSALVLGYALAFGGAIAFALFDVTFYDARINIINWSILAALVAQTPLFSVSRVS